MDSYQSFRPSRIDIMSEEKKNNEHHERNVDPTAPAPAPAFDDILTTVRKEEWYNVSEVQS
jgi:hypothetical protein